MEFGEYPLLNTPHLTVLLLKTAEKQEATIDDVVARLRSLLRLAQEDPPFSDAEFRERLRAVATYLADAGLILIRAGDRLSVTGAGRRAIADCPEGFDTADLVGQTEVRRRIRQQRRDQSADDPRGAQYAGGYNAYMDGQKITDNPFRQDSIDHLAWEDGWCEARDDALLSQAADGSAVPEPS